MYRFAGIFAFFAAAIAIWATSAAAGRVEPMQVRLEVRFTEVDRTASRQFGIDFRGLGGEIPTAGFGTVGQPAELLQEIGLNVGSSSDLSISDIVGALERSGLARTLAEPNLMALSGETARFLAGGEFPVPVTRDGGATSVSFRNFGVTLSFTPMISGDNRINLTVVPEVSQFSTGGVAEAPGINIPALTTGRAETTIELQDGQTFAIAGLLGEETRAQAGKIPVLSNVPILGLLFGSQRYQRGETDLLIFVTPTTVGATGGGSASGTASDDAEEIVEPQEQVLFQVQIAETDRMQIRGLGIDFLGLGGGLPDAGIGTIVSPESLLPGVGATLGGSSELTVRNAIGALERSGLSRILAEPNLMALSGETAQFLAGGEFPVPVTRDGGATSASFRNFGVTLSFTPMISGDNHINLTVVPEVSQFSTGGAAEAPGINIPALTTGRAETTIELQDGQTFAIAGLLGEETRVQAGKIPVLSNVPILGWLFESQRYQRGETDLLIFVTPTIVGATGGGSSGATAAVEPDEKPDDQAAAGVTDSDEFSTTTNLLGDILFFDIFAGFGAFNIGQSAFGTFTDTETAVDKTDGTMTGVAVGTDIGTCFGERINLGFNTKWSDPGWDSGFDAGSGPRTLPQENTEFSRKCETQIGVRFDYFDSDGDSRASEQAGGRPVGFLFLRDNVMLGFTGLSLGTSGIDVETKTEAEGFNLAPYIQTTYFTEFFDDEDTADPSDGTGIRVTGGLDLRFGWSGVWHESMVTSPSFDPMDIRQETTLDVEQDFYGIGYRLELDILRNNWGVKVGGAVAPGYRYQMGTAWQRNVCLPCGMPFDFEQELEFDESGFGLQGELYVEGFYYFTPNFAAYAGIEGTLDTGVMFLVTPEAESNQPTRSSTGNETSVRLLFGARFFF